MSTLLTAVVTLMLFGVVAFTLMYGIMLASCAEFRHHEMDAMKSKILPIARK